jgi:phosphoesterase RecJ-like protein
MIDPQILKRIQDLINASKRIHVFTHANPDGDAISSLAAVNGLLNHLGKTPVLRCDTPIADMYRWFNLEISGSRDLPSPELILCVDTAQRQQFGKLFAAVEHDFATLPVINIDHHFRMNEAYGTVNLVMDTASTSQLLFELMRSWPIPIGPNLANAILYGIISDTYFFQKSNTHGDTFKSAAELTDLGAEPALVAQALVKTRTPRTLQFWGEVLSSIRVVEAGRLAYASITSGLYAKYSLPEYELNLDALVNSMNAIETTRITVLFKERSDEIRVSLRSDYYQVSEDAVGWKIVDVSRIAGRFGGGGHLSAAGCSVKADLATAEREILAACAQALNEDAASGLEGGGSG